MRKHYLLCSIILIVFFAAACGGGGGGTPAPGTGTGTGTATLTWTAPTTYVDGSPLLTVAGYSIYYGTASGSYDTKIDLAGNVTTYRIDNLPAGHTYYFRIKALNAAGVESDFSTPERNKTI